MTSYRTAEIAGALAVVGLLAACTTIGPVNDAPAAVASARTAQDHEKLAAYFDVKVKRYENEAADHAALAQGYARFAGRVNVGGAEHCRGLEGRFKDAAGEARSLAALHRDLAAKAQ